MKLFDIFRKKKKPEKKIDQPEAGQPRAGKKEEVKPEVRKPKKKVSSIAHKVLASPHITEKATGLSEKNKYVFEVFSKSNKIEIKKAIEDLYNVDVENVKIVNIHRKRRRIGRRRQGWKKGYKKAIVKIKKGQKIEIMPR